jgi:hypothetical protein
MPLAESTEFILAGLNPKVSFTAPAKFLVLSNETSVGINSIAVESKVVMAVECIGIDGRKFSSSSGNMTQLGSSPSVTRR